MENLQRLWDTELLLFGILGIKKNMKEKSNKVIIYCVFVYLCESLASHKFATQNRIKRIMKNKTKNVEKQKWWNVKI